MMKLKGCPRCRGDVYIDSDFDGWFEKCIQCGYRRDLNSRYDSSLKRDGQVSDAGISRPGEREKYARTKVSPSGELVPEVSQVLGRTTRDG